MPRRGENIFRRKDGRWEARYVKAILIIKNYMEVFMLVPILKLNKKEKIYVIL